VQELELFSGDQPASKRADALARQVGYVQDLWRNGAIEKAWGFCPTPDNTHFFICGSPQMIDDAVSMLKDEGYKEHTKKEPGQIHVERYW
jgi:ferredoxin--NADP+ reductase